MFHKSIHNSTSMRPEKLFVILKSLERVGFAWWSGTYVLFLLQNGLTLEQTTHLNFVYMTCNFLFDAPTGWLGDKYGQKLIYALGGFTKIISFVVYGLSRTYGGFLAAELFGAVSSALISEALEAWLYNLVGEEVQKRARADARKWGSLLSIPAAIAGTVSAQLFGLALPWFLSAGTYALICVVCVLDIRNGKHIKKEQPSFKEAVHIVVTTKNLVLMAVVLLVMQMCYQPLNMFWAPVFKGSSEEVWWLGFVWAGVSISLALGSMLGKKLGTSLRLIGLMAFGIGVSVVVASVRIFPMVTVVAYYLHELGRASVEITIGTYINRFVPNHLRSTINSILSVTETIGAALGLLVFGWLVGMIDPTSVWLVAGVILSVFGLLLTVTTVKKFV